jgi:sugar phosphate isomerase/epimerase
LKFASQEGLVPGNSFQEKINHLAEYGYEGVELSGAGLAGRIEEIQTALKGSPVRATCICGGFKFGLLFPKKEEREQSKREIKELLELAARVEAEGVIVVPIFGPPQLPDMSPWKTAVELEEELLLVQLKELADYAGTVGTKVILEPLNRYETHLLNRLDHAVRIAEQVNSPHMTILADFFHMNIEEANIGDSIRAAGKWIGYVHLADSNRVLPGLGHTDFRSGFAALQDIGYGGWMSLECGVPGDRAEALTRSLQFMKAQL